MLRAARRREEISGTGELVRNADADGDGSWLGRILDACQPSAEDLLRWRQRRIGKQARASSSHRLAVRLRHVLQRQVAEYFSTEAQKHRRSTHGGATKRKQRRALRAARLTPLQPQTGSRDWWRAIDAVVEELAYPPPLADVLPEDAAAAAAEDGGASYGTTPPTTPKKSLATSQLWTNTIREI